jgi:hypothetical protein
MEYAAGRFEFLATYRDKILRKVPLIKEELDKLAGWLNTVRARPTNFADKINGVFDSKAVKYGYVCHSQGCNITLKELQKVCVNRSP